MLHLTVLIPCSLKIGSGKIAHSLVRVCLSQIPDIILVTSGRSIYALQRLASLASVLTAIKNKSKDLPTAFFHSSNATQLREMFL